MATVTSSRRRSERASGSSKVAASTPKPRQTSVGNRGAQAGPLKPGTRTSGTPQVNSSSPAMRQIQAKASAARAQANGSSGPKEAITLPNSRRAGVNLPKTGAQVVRPPAGQMSPARTAALKAQGATAKAAAQVKRGARAAMSNMSKTLANKGSVLPGRPVGNIKAGLAGAAIEQIANKALSPLAQKAGTVLGKALRPAARALDDRLPGINSKDELRRKTAASKAAMAKSAKAGPSPKATVQAFDKKTFEQAFKAARTAQAKTFTWRGNKYNTKLKGEK